MADEVEPQEPLENILNSKLDPPKEEEPKPTEPEAEAAPDAKADDAPPEEDKAEEKGDKAAEPEGDEAKDATPAPEDDDQTPREKAAYAKSRDEERKRKEAQEARDKAENRNRELEAELAARKVADKPKEPEKEETPDPLTDPEGYDAYLDNKANMRMLNAIFNRSQFDAVKEHGKEAVDKAQADFEILCASDPGLINKVYAHSHPFEFMRTTVANAQRASDIENLDDWRDQEKAKIRTELEAEASGKAETKEKQKSSIPENLADATAAKGPTGSVEAGITPLSEIVTELAEMKVKR